MTATRSCCIALAKVSSARSPRMKGAPPMARAALDDVGPPSRSRAKAKQASSSRRCGGPRGISITEAAERCGWQAHTVRGAISGALKKKRGLKVESEKVERPWSCLPDRRVVLDQLAI